MAILAYDEVMLREPRLLVPKLGPIGLVKANLDNPTVAKLTYLGVGAHRYDLIKGTALSRGANSSVSCSVTGPALVGSAANDLAIEIPNISFSGTGNYTYLIFAAPSLVASREAGISLCSGAATPQSYILFNTDGAYSGAAGTLSYGAFKNGSLTQFNSKITGRPHTFAQQKKAPGAGNTNCWFDGQILGTTDDSANIEVTARLRISGIYGYTGWTQATPYFLTAFAPVALSDAEIAAWCADPFSLVVPA